MVTTHTGVQTRKRMGWVIFVAGAVLAWGGYGALLFEGQVRRGNPLKALLCVGIAYFLIGVLVPLAGLTSQGALSGFSTAGLVTATIAGALGAIGAACIIWAVKTGGVPFFLPPLGLRNEAHLQAGAGGNTPPAPGAPDPAE